MSKRENKDQEEKEEGRRGGGVRKDKGSKVKKEADNRCAGREEWRKQREDKGSKKQPGEKKEKEGRKEENKSKKT